MSTPITRRDAVKLVAGSAALGLGLGRFGSATAAESITCINYGFVLGIHCPSTRGLLEECPEFGLNVDIQRFQKARDIVQTMIGGRGDVAVSGPISVLRSIQAGSDLTIIGNNYLHTSLVVVVNTDFINSFEDFTKPDVTVGINSQGDITQVMMIGGMLKAGADPAKVRWADIGGSGSRMRALISQRTHASVIHFDQVPQVQQGGNFKILLVPAEHYDPWVNEIFFARREWLADPDNRSTAVKVMKGVITAHRQATSEFAYYKKSFLDYATLKGKESMPEEDMRTYWQTLAKDMGVWPENNSFKRSNIENLMPYYVAAGAVKDAPIDLRSAVDETIVDQALGELG